MESVEGELFDSQEHRKCWELREASLRGELGFWHRLRGEVERR